MTDLDIIEESGNYRVRLEVDDTPEKPYDEGACPVLQLSFSYYNHEFNAFNDQANGFEAKYQELADRVGKDILEVFERYLRVFHGCRSFVYRDSDNYRYVAFDTAAWREKVGLTDEWLLQDPMQVPKVAEGSLEEVVSWANGEVYGYIVEKKVHVTVTRTDATGEDVRTSEHYDWDEVEACWGHYGREWAEQAAKEALAAEL